MPRFVILDHDHPELHWDLMLEAGDALRTWRLAEPPEPGRTIDATALGDHRAMYLNYEGPVSGDRGTVKRWDSGTFEEMADSTPTRRMFSLTGRRVIGQVKLTQVDGASWRFVWESR
ncbi:MAG: hypothetical protein HYX68_26450 [Planctomycetes bacterium]|jgi:hypothetical protein|nr:hypothetical protein [Planctomycetota bacterium]